MATKQDKLAAISLYEVETDLFSAMEEWATAQDYLEELEKEAQKQGYEDEELEETRAQVEENARALYAVVQAYIEGAKTKRDSLARYFLNLQAQEVALSAEITRLYKRRHSAKNRLERLKTYLNSVMVVSGQDRLEGQTFRLRRQRNPPSVEVVDEEAVPDSWRKPPVRPEPDKTRIGDALMAEALRLAKIEVEQTGEDVSKDELGALLESYQMLDEATYRLLDNKGDKEVLEIPGVRLITNAYHIRVE